MTYLCLEETKALWTARAIAARAGVPYKRLAQDQSLNEHEQLLEVDRALTWLDDLSPVFTLLTGETLRSLDEDTVCGAVAAAKADLVLVDYLQKVESKGESRVYGLEGVMNRLHAAALRDRRAVIVGAQVGRDMVQGAALTAPLRPPRLWFGGDVRAEGAAPTGPISTTRRGTPHHTTKSR